MENLKSGLLPNVQQKNRTSYPLGYSKVGQAQGVYQGVYQVTVYSNKNKKMNLEKRIFHSIQP